MIVFFRKLKSWIVRIFRWLIIEPAQLYFSIFVVPIIVGSLWLITNQVESTVRISGMLLELFGLGTVAFGISSNRKLFNHPGYKERLVSWFKRFPKFNLKNIALITSPGEFTTTTSNPGFEVSESSELSLEERVKHLEDGLKEAESKIKITQNNLDQDIREVKGEVKNESSKRETEHKAIKELINEAVAGGIELEAIGVLWISVGIVLASLSVEIAEFFETS